MARSQHDQAFQALRELMIAPGEPHAAMLEFFHLTMPPELAKVDHLVEASAKYSDRDAAIIYGANIEQALETAIIETLPAGQKASALILSYGEDGLLSSFQDKINMAYALGLYDERVRKDLWRIKAIRNCFAHARRELTFGITQIAACCGYVEAWKRILNPTATNGARHQFVASVAILTALILTKDQRMRGMVLQAIYGSSSPPTSPQK